MTTTLCECGIMMLIYFCGWLINSIYSPLVMKVRSRASSIMSGASTPGGGAFRSLSEGDLEKADAALNRVNGLTGR